MSKISWKGGTLLSPVPPALITCSDGEKTNVFTAAWTGILCSDPPKTYISVRPSRYSHSLISRTKEFVINLPTVELVRTVDFCGVKAAGISTSSLSANWKHPPLLRFPSPASQPLRSVLSAGSSRSFHSEATICSWRISLRWMGNRN